MRKKNFLQYAALVLVLAAGSSRAATLWNQAPNQSGGSELNNLLEADDFTVASASVITQIKFWSAQGVAGDYAGSIAWSINQNLAGVPGAIVASGTDTPAAVSTGNAVLSLFEYSYTWTVNVPLAAGTYWLVLHNGPNGSIPSTDFYWGWNNANAGNSQQQDLNSGPNPWTDNFAALAFDLQADAVPEPASMLLIGAGLAGAWLIRGRRNS